ncbi:MAG: hypothetical protein HYU36_05725 [Planctomycetes bacterium]|nr:hypothetical protein [Planctomycetota bacterium]
MSRRKDSCGRLRDAMRVERRCSIALWSFLLYLASTAPSAGAWWESARREPSSLEPVFGQNAEGAWKISSGEFSVSFDLQLGKEILTAHATKGLYLDGLTQFAGERHLKALVRLPVEAAPQASAGFILGRKSPSDRGYRVTLTATRDSETIQCSVLKNGQALRAPQSETPSDWDAPFSSSLAFTLRAYAQILPGWPEDYRTLIEADMASIPDHNRKWLAVRMELAVGEARFWLDDRLVSVKRDAAIQPDGAAGVELSPGTQLAYCRIGSSWREPEGFLPVELDGYTNARALLGGETVSSATLPPPGERVRVQGIPFVFSGMNPEGHDHIDVGRSLYRQANAEGYHPSSGPRWMGSALRDPARTQLRVPNGRFDTLHLIAASDSDPEEIPLVSALFFRPTCGFAETFEGTVPLAAAKASECVPLPVTLSGGKKVNLWLVKIPLDPGRLSSFSDLDIVEIELTKKVHQYRSYPDPFIYGWHQGGPPSAVHVYALTLGRAPVEFELKPDRFGHVWTSPEVSNYAVHLSNQTDAEQQGRLMVATRSFDGTETTQQEFPIKLVKRQTILLRVSFPVKLFGYHDLEAALEIAGRVWKEKRSFVQLAPDARSPRWEAGKGALFGYWSYHGGHYTPKAEHHVSLMTRAGARTSISLTPGENEWVQKHWSRVPAGAWEVAAQPWAREDPYDPKQYQEYQEKIVKAYTDARERIPEALRPDHVYFFPEPHVSLRLTAGNYPTYWGDPDVVLTDEEKSQLRMYFVTAKCAAEGIRKKWPDLKILIPWGDPLFIVPLLRAGFPRDLIDGSGLDICGFERLPEQQLHQISVHRLYTLKKEYEKAGIPKPQLQYCEGIFVPTEVGACSWREQMDIYHRWTLISMAYGIERFYSGWFAFDCGSYYGSEHYGGCGIQRRIPYGDPKPAYAAYATMTDRLNQANFDGWLGTGSLTTYCLRFRGPRGPVYALWTLRGKRPIRLILQADAAVNVTDSMNNTRLLNSRDRAVTFLTDPSVVYVTAAGEVESVELGGSDHSDSRPAPDAVSLADLGDGSWRYTSQRDMIYENNDFDTARALGKFSSSVVEETGRGPVLASRLDPQDRRRELMPWYNSLSPRKPIVIPGAGDALGLWVRGDSDWGRFIYCLRDARGERWISIGSKDEWNCDDVHSWSAFNFDGWRYLRFELPRHLGYDQFRMHGTTWWRSEGGDGVVDLPLRLETILVEQRTHILYVNDVQPVASDTVLFGKLFVEYDSPEDRGPEAVRLSRLRMPRPRGLPDLPNPIRKFEAEGVGSPVSITGLRPPEHQYDGTRVHVDFQEAPDAKVHQVWVAAYPDGRGAQNLTPSSGKSGVLVHGLRPGVPFTFWVVYQDANGRWSKPSAPVTQTLINAFKEQ